MFFIKTKNKKIKNKKIKNNKKIRKKNKKDKFQISYITIPKKNNFFKF